MRMWQGHTCANSTPKHTSRTQVGSKLQLVKHAGQDALIGSCRIDSKSLLPAALHACIDGRNRRGLFGNMELSGGLCCTVLQCAATMLLHLHTLDVCEGASWVVADARNGCSGLMRCIATLHGPSPSLLKDAGSEQSR